MCIRDRLKGEALQAHNETKPETTFFLYNEIEELNDLEVREEVWKQWNDLTIAEKKMPENLSKRPPDSMKPVTRDDRRRLEARTNEAVRKYQFYPI